MLFVILVNILYAISYPLGKISLNYATPLFLTAFRMIIGGLSILFYKYFFQKDSFSIRPAFKYAWPIIGASFFSVYLTSWLEFYGLEDLTPAKTAFLYNMYPFASALLSYIYLHESLSKGKWLGLIIGFLGTLPLLITDPTHSENPARSFLFFFSLPELAVLLAVFASPLGWMFIQKLINNSKIDSLMANGVTMLLGGIIALIHSFFVDNWNPLPIGEASGFLITSLSYMLLINIVANVLYMDLLKKYSFTFISFTSFATPLLTAFFDYLLFNYTISHVFYISTYIMFIGVFLFYRDELKAK